MFTRSQALDHLANEFAALAVEIGLPESDTQDGFGPPLDRALRALGYAEFALPTASVTDTEIPAFLALAEYYALLRFQRALAVRGDIDKQKLIGPRSQIFQQVRDLLDAARDNCASYGYALTGAPAWEFGQLGLDYIEAEL